MTRRRENVGSFEALDRLPTGCCRSAMRSAALASSFFAAIQDL
jgi:hypothetical protein